MPEYLAPAVYVEEVDTGSKPIEGVSTSTAGMVGVAERGPVNVPILVTSAGEYRRWFGDMLDPAEFVNANGPHCFLPFGVEAFFTNGGKRVYVTRVESTASARAIGRLHDRGAAASVTTMLLRAAAIGTGTAVSGPTVAVLDPGALGNGDTIRIGDGSAAEYRTITGALGAARHIPLRFPIHAVHAGGAATPLTNFNRAVTGGAGAIALRPVAPLQPGDRVVRLQASSVAQAALVAPGQLLEFGTTPLVGEHRIVVAATLLAAGGDTLDITLDSPLENGLPTVLAPATNIARLDRAAAANIIPAPTTLLAQAIPGQSILFGDVLGGQFTGALVEIGAGATTEVRAIGALRHLTLGQGAYDDYPAGTRIDRFVATAQRYTTTGALVGATFPVGGGVAGLRPGQTLVAAPAGAPVIGVVQSVDAAANTVTLTAAPAALPAGSVVQIGRSTTAAVPAGSVTIPVSARVGLAAGDMLLVGAAANQEWVEVDELLPPLGATPDAGTVRLAAPTRLPHAIGEPLLLHTMGPAGGATSLPTYLLLDQPDGATAAYVAADPGFSLAPPDVLRFALADGRFFFHVLTGNVAAASREAILDRPLARPHDAAAIVAQRGALIEVTALDTGGWGNRIRVSVEDEEQGLVSGANATGFVGANQLVVSSLMGIEPGTVLEMRQPGPNGAPIGPLMKVTAIDRNNGRITVDGALDPAHIAAIPLTPPLRSIEFSLSVMLLRRPDPLVPARDDMQVALEQYRNLSMDPRHSRYFQAIVGWVNAPPRISDRRPDGASSLVRVRDLGSAAAQLTIRRGPEALVDILPSGEERAARHALEVARGDDGIAMLDDATYIGQDADDPDDRTGLFSLQNVEEISIVAVPGRTRPELQNALITQCETMRYRFAVLDGPQPDHDLIADVRALRQQYDTRYAALYHPWLLIPQPFPAPAAPEVISIPPSGSVVGVYARTDIERGVHKAPANEVVRGITGVHRILSKSEQDILNPYPVNINVIRDFRRTNRGIRIWGGRVITSDSDWKYVNVRRLLIFIEASVERGLQWVVFEPNAEPLWARVRRTVANFLRVVWRNGALEGTKPEEAFFVRCDRTTMTQAEIDNGQLIVLVGVAPVKPAEFVIVRIGLWTAHTED